MTVNCKLLQHVETSGSKEKNTQYRDIWYYIIHSTQWLTQTKKTAFKKEEACVPQKHKTWHKQM